MFRWIPALLIFVPLVGFSAPLPPDVALLADKISATEARLDVLRADMDRLNTKQHDRAARLEASTRAMAQMAGYPPPLLLSYALLANVPSAPGILAASQHSMATDMQHDAVRLVSTGKLWEETHAQLDDLKGLKDQFIQSKGQLAGLEKQALRQASLQADELQARMEHAMDVSVTGVVSSHVLPPPVVPVREAFKGPIMPMAGRLVGRFAPARESWGITLEGRSRAKVHCVSAGNVLYSGPFRDKGGLVIVDGGQGMLFIYAGFESLLVNEGQKVEAGAPLGTLDATPKPRLYLEMRLRGRPIDPERVLAGR